eukprot:16140-Heterococcus_DN1.PRE.2
MKALSCIVALMHTQSPAAIHKHSAATVCRAATTINTQRYCSNSNSSGSSLLTTLHNTEQAPTLTFAAQQQQQQQQHQSGLQLCRHLRTGTPDAVSEQALQVGESRCHQAHPLQAAALPLVYSCRSLSLLVGPATTLHRDPVSTSAARVTTTV